MNESGSSSTDSLSSSELSGASTLSATGCERRDWTPNKRFEPKVFKPSQLSGGNIAGRSAPFKRKGKYFRSRYELMEIFADSLDSVHGMMALRIFQETFGGCVFAFSMSRVADMVKIGVYRMFVLVGSMTYWSERTNSPSSSEEDQRIDRPEALAVMFVVENEIERSLHCDYWAVKQQAQSHGVVMVKLFRELLRDIGYMWLSAECEPQLLKDYVRGGAINTGIDYYFINTDNKYFPMHFVVWPLQNQMDISLERVRGMATVVIQELRLKVHGISGCPLEGRPPKNFQRCDPLESLIRSRRKNAEYLGTRSLPTTMEMEPSQECTCFILPLLGLIIRRSLARRRTQPT